MDEPVHFRSGYIRSSAGSGRTMIRRSSSMSIREHGPARGEGKSKRQAEQEAAKSAAEEKESGLSEASTRCGFVAIIGAPNSGKSTLLNTLAGYKLAIVSRKVQTTRSRIRAIIVEGRSQIMFVDTPGIFLPSRRLDEAMVKAAWGGATDADVVLCMVDARPGSRRMSNALPKNLQKIGRSGAGAE